ncbi:MAG: hypothetical protein ACE367_13655 [Acidimicrobiales bacterium]
MPGSCARPTSAPAPSSTPPAPTPHPAPRPRRLPRNLHPQPLPDTDLLDLFATTTPTPAQVTSAEPDLAALPIPRNDGRYIPTTNPDNTPGPIAFFGWTGD